jgi:hypothetical protein
MAVYRLRLHHFQGLAEGRLRDHTVDEEGRTVSGDGASTAAEAEEAEAADSMIEDSQAYHLANGEEAKHHQIESESESESQASVGEDGAEKAEMIGVVEAEEEDAGSPEIHALPHALRGASMHRDQAFSPCDSLEVLMVILLRICFPDIALKLFRLLHCK